MVIQTSSGPVEFIHPSKIAKLIQVEKAHQTFQQYNQLSSYNPVSTYQTSTNPIMSTYTRQGRVVQYFNDRDDFILESLVSELYDRVVPCRASDFVEAFEDICVDCAMNFGVPTHVTLFGDVLIAGQFEPTVIKFKEITPNQGALIVYQPNKFTVCRLQEPCPYMRTEPLYDKYASKIIIKETLSRLGLE